MKKAAAIAIAGVIALAGVGFLFRDNLVAGIRSAKASGLEQTDDDKKDKKKKKKKETAGPVSSEVTVVNTWTLPAGLTEISGLEYLSKDRFACVQDEEGTIFIYNTAQNKVEKEIPFGGAGDYEGIAVAGTTAYVVRSDGRLFEVSNFESTRPVVKEYATPLTADHDVEGLCYDPKNNRLLLAIKGEDPGNQRSKGIYAFDLVARKLAPTPAVQINLEDDIFSGSQEKKLKNIMQPSDLEVHPTTGDLYITEGASPKLLIMDAEGNKKHLYRLSTSDFPQAEGITFTPDGELFISNEGKGGSGTIVNVQVKNQ